MATVCKGPRWKDHRQAGKIFSTAHLAPHFIDYRIDSIEATRRIPARPAIVAKLRFSYSHHCFTRSLVPAHDANPDSFYRCTARKETRAFCIDRWEESKSLPTIMANLRKCYFTRHHNYFVVRRPLNPELGEYFVYFTVRLHPSAFVDVKVESAYVRGDVDPKAKARKVKFSTLVINALKGVQTRAAP